MAMVVFLFRAGLFVMAVGNLEIQLVDPKSNKKVATVQVDAADTIAEIKQAVQLKKGYLYPDRQALRLEPRGAVLKDDVAISSLKLSHPEAILYFRDLGPQVGWKTVFLTEYAGPLFVYALFYTRPKFIYGSGTGAKIDEAVHIAFACWTFHYAKRLLETIFIHRFSHATMPLRNIFKNCGYYWGFAAFVGYFNNHPFYTPPIYGKPQLYLGLAAFLISEYGNFSIHKALRDLRPAGSKERRIPVPTANPFTGLFALVCCPNYTYEVLSWFSFAVLSQSFPALLFAFAGFYQMSVWAIGKKKLYKKEFTNFPKNRTAIIPFLL